MKEVLRELPVSQLEIDPGQPRRVAGDLEGLKRSIRQSGILQPPIVTPIGPDRYGVRWGGRRVQAAQELGLETITCIVRTVDEHERLYLQLIENLQREDLDPFEQADSFRRLKEEHGISEGDLGEKVGKSQDYVSRVLSIANGIPEEIREEYYATSRKVSPSMLLEIARAKSVAAKLRMWRRARDGSYTVKQARAERAEEKRKGKDGPDGTTRKRIPLDRGRGTVVVQWKGSATMEEVLEMLREAVTYWEQRMALWERYGPRRRAR